MEHLKPETIAGMWIVGEDMPQETNHVTLNNDNKDQHGLPVVNVHFDDHPNDIAMRNHAYKQGAALYDAVGATRTFPTPSYPSIHNLGTNRMSENARDSVVNKWAERTTFRTSTFRMEVSSPQAPQKTQRSQS